MPVYRFSIWVAHPDLVVQAKDQDEAEKVVSEFFRGAAPGGKSEKVWTELVSSMDVEIEDCDESDYETDDIGLTKDSPYEYVKLIPDNEDD